MDFGFYLENQLGVNYALDWYFGSDLVLIKGFRDRRTKQSS